MPIGNNLTDSAGLHLISQSSADLYRVWTKINTFSKPKMFFVCYVDVPTESFDKFLRAHCKTKIL